MKKDGKDKASKAFESFLRLAGCQLHRQTSPDVPPLTTINESTVHSKACHVLCTTKVQQAI